MNEPPTLTPRQEQIPAHIGQGMTNREIGDRLGLSEKTVKNSVTVVLAAQGVRHRSQAAVYAATGRTVTVAAPTGPEPARARGFR